MRKVLLSGVIVSLLVLAYMPVFAQSGGNNPDTQNTDKSEDDWRKSKKKRTNTDPFDILKSPKGFGSNFPLPPIRPIDELPEESARHLKSLRARAIATNSVGQEINADKTYTPSEAAKTDADLETREKQVWQEMVKDMNATGKSGQTSKKSKNSQNKGKNSAQNSAQKSGQKPDNNSRNPAGSSGEDSSQSSDNKDKQSSDSTNRRGGNKSGSPLRGGSTSSASEIMARIKGTGQDSQSQNPQPSNSQPQNSQSRTGSNNHSQKDGQAKNKGKTQSNSGQGKPQKNQVKSNTSSQKTNNDANTDKNTDFKKNNKQKIILSPLELAKKSTRKRQDKCSTSSASAYIKNTNGRADNCD